MSISDDRVSVQAEVEAALEGLRRDLRIDGYDLQVVRLEGPRLDLAIRALEGACEECLVPQAMMQRMIVATLPAHLQSLDVRLEYPTEGSGAPH